MKLKTVKWLIIINEAIMIIAIIAFIIMLKMYGHIWFPHESQDQPVIPQTSK